MQSCGSQVESCGLPKRITDAGTGDIIEFFYDSNQRPSSVKLNTQTVLTTAYDIKGNLQSSLDASGRLMQFSYDGLNRLTREVGADDSFTAYQWACCFIETVRTGKMISGNEKTLRRTITIGERGLAYDYDTWRRPKTITQDAGDGYGTEIHTFANDLLGRVTTIDGPWADDTISYAYNDVTRSGTRTSPGGMTQTTTANAAGQTASIANILGTFSNTYDGLGGALTSITHSGANAGFNTAFTYHGDAFDRALATLTATKPGGATIAKHSYTYDNL